jgi:hypothetical protein
MFLSYFDSSLSINFVGLIEVYPFLVSVAYNISYFACYNNLETNYAFYSISIGSILEP